MDSLRAALRLMGVVAVTAPVLLLLLLARILRRPAPRREAALLSWIGNVWARGCAWVVGLRIRVEGTPPEPPFFLVSNHLSYLDVVVLYTRLKGRFLAKTEVSGWPVMGWLSRLAGTLYIDRERQRDLSRVLSEVRATLAGGGGVVVFPEGTSSCGDEVRPFKPSIFEVPIRTGVAVSYAALSYRTPEGAPPAHLAVCWWGDMPFFRHFFTLLTLPRIDATVVFGTHPLTAEDRKDLALRAQRAVESQFTPVVGAKPA